MVNDVGSRYYDIGDYEKAAEYYKRALKGYESALGKDHPDTLEMVDKLGVLYYGIYDYEKALEYFGKASKGYESNPRKKSFRYADDES